jgi:hypothetical protein
MKVFWAWQSDLPGKTGRHFIKEALNEAIDRINESRDIEEPDEALQSGMHLDHDRKGLSGSPDLANEILKKIDASTVFVGDVTPVGKGVERKNDEDAIKQKSLINPNVAIELGYALKSITTNNVWMVMNSHYGSRADLPFDLGQKGGPIMYSLPPNADKKTIEVERSKLVGVLFDAFSMFVPRPVIQPFEEMKPKIGRGIYFADGEVLVRDDRDPSRTEYMMPLRDVIWLRVIPTKPLSIPLSIGDLLQPIGPAGSFGGGSDTSRIRPNAYGVALFSPAWDTTNIDSISQFTRDGEIWGVNAELLRLGNQPETLRKYVFTAPIEDQFLYTLRRYMELIRVLGKVDLPVRIEAGIEGISGYIIAHEGPAIDRTLVMHKNFVIHRGTLTTFEAIDQGTLLLDFFCKLNNNTGVPRPPGLYGRG